MWIEKWEVLLGFEYVGWYYGSPFRLPWTEIRFRIELNSSTFRY